MEFPKIKITKGFTICPGKLLLMTKVCSESAVVLLAFTSTGWNNRSGLQCVMLVFYLYEVTQALSNETETESYHFTLV